MMGLYLLVFAFIFIGLNVGIIVSFLGLKAALENRPQPPDVDEITSSGEYDFSPYTIQELYDMKSSRERVFKEFVRALKDVQADPGLVQRVEANQNARSLTQAELEVLKDK
jgi:hypothetical protein